MDKKAKQQSIKITAQGSLGLLASGDIGIRAWRAAIKSAKKNKDEEA